MSRPGWPTRVAVVLLVAAPPLAGCGARHAGPAALRRPAGPPATGPAALALEQITPVPHLPAPATSPAGSDEPPLDAITLFARARAQAQDGRRFMAVALLEQAIDLDPGSYELHYELGRAHRDGVGYEPRAAAAFERAAALEPDRLDAQLDLGRQHLAKGDAADALRRFRLAALTTDYRAGDVRSAEVDFLLAHTLRELGYDRAALDRYELLIARLDQGDVTRAGDINDVLSTRLFVQVGDLYLKQDRPAEALAAYRKAEEAAARGGGEDLEVQGRVVRALLIGGRVEEGLSLAAEQVRRSRAAPAALALLRDVYAALGRPEGAVQALADLHRRSPDDRAVLFALCEALAAGGRGREADERLAAAWQRSAGDPDLLARPDLFVRWFRLRFEYVDPAAAATLLVEVLAEHPELADQVGPVWRRLLSADGRRKLAIDRLAQLAVPPASRAAHRYVVWRVARDWPRSTLARTSLDAAVAARPAFPPAYRARLDEVLTDGHASPTSRLAAADVLAAGAEQAGDPGLAAELRGHAVLADDRPAAAVDLFADAVRRQPDAPSPRLGLARALRAAAAAAGSAVAESSFVGPPPAEPSSAPATARPADTGDDAGDDASSAWAVIKRFPAYGAAYADAADHAGRDERQKVLAAWKAAQPTGEPTDPALVVRQAEDQLARGRGDAAELLLADLENDDPAGDQLLAALERVYARTGRPDRFATKLEQRLGDLPRIGPAGLARVAIRLATLYLARDQSAEATRVLDFARAVVGDEPDLLYEVALLYRRAGATEAAGQALTAVTRLDPRHAAAAGLLAGLPADEGGRKGAVEPVTR